MFSSFSCVLLAISFTLNSVKCNSIVKYYPHIQANAENHNTRKYQTINEGSGQLVLRRGQVFIVELDLSKPFDANTDDVMVVASPINPLFEHKTFMAVLYIIEKYGLSPITRSDPVMLSRAFSSLVNSNDNLGVLVGRWDGKYESHEASNGLYRCGPCPRNAAKYGKMFIEYDAPFLYSEVNADVINWMQDASGLNMTKTSRNKLT
ncbi:protein-glutamine gamma-glutamyltransferase K-like protein [Leptotrombidium deliense]|uniref:Protein-glutamine gamma-glutamyltransferase K-like protein n=1 Tax=Leptotrombidium deliense TaxID=299467 RepID=A0A443S9M0_9ACAR|nr:protein-glutamine gamma-glutamyltransferase K-like protein [Leptotrombidium deliense]